MLIDAFYDKLADILELPLDTRVLIGVLFERHGNLPKLQDILFSSRCAAKKLQKRIERLSKQTGTHSFTLNFYILFISAKRLHSLYEKNNISLDVFWNSIKDLKYKLDECLSVSGTIGILAYETYTWFPGFYRLKRFALGRFQYDIMKYLRMPYKKHGLTIYPHDTVYNCHIPSSGPLSKEDAYDSYRKAYEFFGNKPITIICDSWLLYPPQREFLPSSSRILEFMDDFDIISFKNQDKFNDAWRIFGKDHHLPPDKLPRNTGLQRAYADRLMSGKPTGTGFGVLIFDGEKIINK
jgi:hypothetical protein